MSLILDLIYPRFCAGCGRAGDYLCSDCLSSLTLLSLQPPSAPLSGILSVFRYRDPIRSLVRDLKFNYVADIAPFIGKILSQTIIFHFPHLLRYWQDQGFVLTPIPLHSFRENYRGFNQSSLVAQSLARSLRLDYQENLIIRSRFTSTQSLQEKTHRVTNVASAFSAQSSLLVPSKLILFDDVCTTASTLKSAASILPQNSEVFAVTIAG